MNIPEGFVLVPKEPTKEMIEARAVGNTSVAKYKAMLAAAPAIPMVENGTVTSKLEEAMHYLNSPAEETGYTDGQRIGNAQYVIGEALELLATPAIPMREPIFPSTGLEPRGCPMPGACACPSPKLPTVEEVERAVHEGRFMYGSTPTPFEEEDRRGQEYCRHIANVVLGLFRSATPVDRDGVLEEAAAHLRDMGYWTQGGIVLSLRSQRGEK